MFERSFERLAGTDLLIAVALATFIVPAIFLAVVAVAGHRRVGGRPVGRRLENLVALTGGLAVGTMLLFGSDPVLAAPLLLVPAAIGVGLWRARRRVQAGWLLLGSGLPVAGVWGLIVVGPQPFEPRDELPIAAAWAAAGAIGVVIGAALLLRGDPAPAAPSMAAPAGQPGSRSIGSIAAAIREPGMIGPFGLPELSMLAAFIAVQIGVPFWLPADIDPLVRIAISGLVASVIAAEAYIRGMPPRSRRAFEAFSWLGEWELARARQLTGRSVPTSEAEAVRWLAARPERVDRLAEAAIRVEVLLFAGRIDEARALVERMAARAETAWERFEVAALQDLVGWRSGGDGDLAGMDAAAEAILPRDSDDRLRAEVTVAVARVRRRMADGRSAPGDAVEPLLEVRERLGQRANGQVGRALRPRLIPVLLLSSVLFGVVMLGLDLLGPGAPG